MKKPNSRFKKNIEKMFQTQDFENLEQYESSEAWDTLAPDERELLAVLFVLQGEKKLFAADKEFSKSFEIANLIAPKHPFVIFRQGFAYAKQRENLQYYKKAIECFKKTVKIKKDYLDAWQEWANTLVQIGKIKYEEEPFKMAIKIFEDKEGLIPPDDFERLAAYYHDWGLCYYWLGKVCGEPLDFQQSIKYFEKAEANGRDLAIFWNDFGNAYTEVANLVCKIEFIYKSITYFMKAVKADDQFYFGWANLGATLNLLYKITNEDIHFQIGNDAFEKALKLQSDEWNIWLRWGEILLAYGKNNNNLTAVKDAVNRFEIAGKLTSNHHSYLLGHWGEALLWLGLRSNDIKYFKNAKNKLTQAIALEPKEPYLYNVYARCLNEFGNYFEEEKYFREAIEIADKGHDLDPSDPSYYHIKTIALYGIADIFNDPVICEEAILLLEQMDREVSGISSPIFWADWGLGHAKIASWTDNLPHAEVALEKYQKALDLLAGKIDLNIYANYADLLVLVGDLDENCICYEKAIEIYRKILEIDPDEYEVRPIIGHALHRIGFLRADTESLRQSIKEQNIYLEKEPDDGKVCDQLGTTYIALGLMFDNPSGEQDAAHCFQQAEMKLRYALSLGNPTSYYHLACLYAIRDNAKEAFQCLEKAKSVDCLPPISLIKNDDWLDNIRQMKEFDIFINTIEEEPKDSE